MLWDTTRRSTDTETTGESAQRTPLHFILTKMYRYGPLVDGNIIRDLPSREFLAGHFTKIPMLMDHEGYEGFAFTNQSLNTSAEVAADLAQLWPNAGKTFFERLFQLYPASNFNSSVFQRQQIFGDAFISCPTYYMSTAASDYDLPVWKLNFDAGSELHGATQAFVYSTSINRKFISLRIVAHH